MNSPAGPLPGVVVLERGWLSSNNILCIGSGQTALVDSGYVTHAAQTQDLVAHALGGRQLDLLLNTHLHSDHCGGNASLQRAYPGLDTRVPSGELEAAATWDEEKLSYRATGQQCERFRVNAALTAGDVVQLGDLGWEIHSAPGHDPHAVILFEPRSRCLISGDALWENGFGLVFPELLGEPGFDETAATLDLIERLAPQCVVPGHGGTFSDVGAALAIARRRLTSQIKDPARHARHAIKVLLKFKLLESHGLQLQAWEDWVQHTPYLETIRARFFPKEALSALCRDVLAELVSAGAAAREGDRILNR